LKENFPKTPQKFSDPVCRSVDFFTKLLVKIFCDALKSTMIKGIDVDARLVTNVMEQELI
jgi:hypothetical protein